MFLCRKSVTLRLLQSQLCYHQFLHGLFHRLLRLHISTASYYACGGNFSIDLNSNCLI